MIKNLKKVISTVAAVATLASSASALAVSFPDVDEAASYAGAVEALVALGIVNGDENGKFNPDNSVTRAEFAKMVVEALGETASSNYTKFADAKGHWAAGYIEAGVAKSFINGYDENTFGPDDTVTYAQGVKMLVGACGYDLWAQNQGGWPSGYLAWGSQLDIVNGIAGTVSNDTALTRAQCAVLIYNALKAPILAINGYQYDNLGNLVPKYEAMDGKGDKKEFASMLTAYHDAYVVKGRVVDTAKTADGVLDADKVKFDIELSDNYNGNKVKVTKDKDGKISGIEQISAYVGETDAANLLFTYSEAIVQIDDDTDEATLVSITPYGANKTVEIDADLIKVDGKLVVGTDDNDTEDESDDKAITKDYSDAYGTNPFAEKDPKLAVAKSEESRTTTKYNLDVKGLYVNGKDVDWTPANFVKYVKENTTATVTLIDATQEGSTSTDGKYDYIMVDYYATAVVDSVSVSDSSVKIYFKNPTNKIVKLDYDPEDENKTVSFVKDGAEISPADLAEFDVISVAYDVSGEWDASSYYEVYVSSNAPVTGVLKKVDDKANTLNIDGTDYEVISGIDVNDYTLINEYTLYLDAMGNVAYLEEGETSKNYGIIVGVNETYSNDYPVVKMITADGEIAVYECKNEKVFNDNDAEEDNSVKEILVAAGKTVTETENNDTFLSKKDLTTENVKNLVVTYKLSNGKLSAIEPADLGNKTTAELEYRESSNKLGSYKLSEAATKFVVIEDYLKNGDVGTIELSALEDEAKYQAYLFGKNNNTEYQFVVVLGGLSSVRSASNWGIVKANAQLTEVDGDRCYEVEVVRGVDVATVLVSEDAVTSEPAEGDVVVYSVGTKGYVEKGYYYAVSEASKVQDSAKLYNMWKNTAIADTKYSDEIIEKDSEAKLIFAPIYKKANNSIELFVPTAVTSDGVTTYDYSKSNVNDVVDYTIGSDANLYVYDLSKAEDYRVEAGFVPNQSASIFKSILTGDEKETLVWSTVKAENIDVNYALIKTIDGEVTDVVVYIAD